MKNRYFFLAMAAALTPAFAGTPTVVESPLPPPPVQAPEPEPALSVEIGVSHNWADGHLMKPAAWGRSAVVNTIGSDLTLVYALDKVNSVNLRLGYAWGHGSAAERDSYGIVKERNRMHNISIMPGYRCTVDLSDGLAAFAGANVGVLNSSLKFTEIAEAEGFSFRDKAHDSAWGLGYSLEAGLRCAITPTTEAFVAYQFSGSTAKPKFHDEDWSASVRNQHYHGVRAGVSFKF